MSGTPSRIGAYPIERELGRGGMGVVYLGRDVRLDRPVAIKVLPEALSRDPERLARFEREARILASLRHTNIAGIYGLEESEGRRFLALEYVEGETLLERLARGAMPIEEALDVCRQIAAGVEGAHEGGVIHRDLKPGNVKITPGGEVKVLDFGLAKGGAVSAPSSGTDHDLSLSPTMALAATGVGVILGTAAYMSPEQARGRLVDRRTDIWSFGCVLYECLTGRQLFTGETVSDVLAKILERDPDWSALPHRTPARVRDLLRRCLDKDAKKRLRDIGDARLQLEESLAQLHSPGHAAPDDAGVSRTGRLPGFRGGAIALGLALAGAVGGIAGWSTIGPGGAFHRVETSPEVAHVSVTLPSTIRFDGLGLFPDGKAFGGRGRPRQKDGSGGEAAPMIYMRTLDSYEMKPVPGTEGAVDGFPSADGRSLYFIAPISRGASKFRLSKMSLDAGVPPIGLGEYKDEWGRGIALHGGDILVSLDRGVQYLRLPAAGGDPGQPIKVDAGDYRGTLTPVSLLPDDRGVLMNGIAYGSRGWYYRIALLDLVTNKVRFLLDDAGNAVYAPTGHLLFSRGDALLAAAFDLDRLAITGPPVPIMNGMYTRFIAEPAFFELGANGALLYRPGGVVMNERRLATVDAAGNVTPWTEDRRPYAQPSISRDGSRFSSVITNSRAIDEIWVSDLDRPALRRVASVPDADCGRAALSPDGQWLAFVRTGRDDKDGIYLQRLDGQGEARRIITPAGPDSQLIAEGWSPDGSVFLSGALVEGRTHIRVQRDPRLTDSREEPRPLISGFVDEFDPVFSPDGRMLAFASNESGKTEVYIGSYRSDGTVGDPVRVSSGAGNSRQPSWTAGGKNLLYVTEPRRLMSVAISASPAIAAGAPVQVADLERLRISDFTVLPDGRLFGVLTSEMERNEVTEEHIVLGFFELLKRRMAAAGG